MLDKRKKSKRVSIQMTDTLIGENSVLEGSLHSKASLRIEGVLRGDIHCDGDVTIGKNGHAHSNITARNVVAAGHIEGSIMAKGMLTVTSTGKVQGKIEVAKLSVAEGGIFEGVSQMETIEESAPRLIHSQPDSESEKPNQAKDKKKAASGNS